MLIFLIVSNCQIHCQFLTTKDSVVVITKAAAEQRLIELRDYRVAKQVISQYRISDSIQSTIIKNDSVKFALDSVKITIKDSLFTNKSLEATNNNNKYLLANKEVSRQKGSKKISWIISAGLLILLIIK